MSAVEMIDDARNKRAHNKREEKQEEHGSCQTLVAIQINDKIC